MKIYLGFQDIEYNGSLIRIEAFLCARKFRRNLQAKQNKQLPNDKY